MNINFANANFISFACRHWLRITNEYSDKTLNVRVNVTLRYCCVMLVAAEKKKTLSFSYSKCVLVALVILRRISIHL